MTDLVRYEEAHRALAEALRVDEVATIRSQAKAFAAYARQAKDTDLLAKATAIKLRAERRAGELLRAMEKSGERHPPHRTKKGSDETMVVIAEGPKTLEELGITKDQSSQWQRLAAMNDNDFEKRVDDAQRGARASIEETREEKAERKRVKRASRERELGARVRALPQKKFGLILADPEWEWRPYSDDTGLDRAAKNHYPTSPTSEIMKRDVASIAAADCILALWATIPMLLDAIACMDAWGFSYRSHCIWAKPKAGTGYWFRGKHELLLIGTRGNPVAPAPGTQWDSVIEADVGEHSEKPEVVLEMLDELFPSTPKIELNRRGAPRQGWDAWGNEVEDEEA